MQYICNSVVIVEYRLFYELYEFFSSSNWFASHGNLGISFRFSSFLYRFRAISRTSGVSKYVALTGARNYAIVYYIMSSTWIRQRLPESPTWYIGFFFTVCLCRMRTIRPREPSTLVHPSSRRVACGCFASLVARLPRFSCQWRWRFFRFCYSRLRKSIDSIVLRISPNFEIWLRRDKIVRPLDGISKLTEWPRTIECN